MDWDGGIKGNFCFYCLPFIAVMYRQQMFNMYLYINISSNHVVANNLFGGADRPAEKVTARSAQGV